MKNFFFVLLLILVIPILGCSQKNLNKVKKPDKIPQLELLYKSAFSLYEMGRWNESIELFQKVETHYSFSKWAPQATLMIMYMYYESGESYKTLEYANKFKKLYQKNENINYVEFITGLTFYEQINVISRDQAYSLEALKKFNYIIKNFPNSIYAEEARLKIDLINEQLAGKSMYIARYYMKKSKWIAAIKRLDLILNKYGTTIYTEEALHRLVEIYYKLGNLNEAKKYASILGYNFNSSDWYKKTYKLVVKKDYVSENQKGKKKLKETVKKLFKFSK